MSLAVRANVSAATHWMEERSPRVRQTPSSGAPLAAAATQFDPSRVAEMEQLQKEEMKIRTFPKWGDAAAPLPEVYPCTIYPAPNVDPSVRSMLGETGEKVLTWLLGLLKERAERSSIPVGRVDVTRFTDPEDNSEEVVVTQSARLPADAALKYWDELGTQIEMWLEILPDEWANVLLQSIVIRVRWD